MSNLIFNFYGVAVQATASQEVLCNLKEDFSFFSSGNQAFDLKISLRSFSEAPQNFGVNIYSTRMCRVYQKTWKQRFCVYKFDHFIQAVCLIEEKSAELFCDDPDLAYEIMYTWILSRVGEELDSTGLMRTHGAAVRYQNQNVILMARSGTGKSTLVQNLMSEGNCRIFSDEIALINIWDGKIYPFPIRMAVKQNMDGARVFKRKLFDQKFLVNIPQEKVAEPGEVNKVFWLRNSGQVSFEKLNILSAFQVTFDILLGIGTPQMAEFMLRPTNGLRILKIFSYRVFLLRCLCKGIFSFRRGFTASQTFTQFKTFFTVSP